MPDYFTLLRDRVTLKCRSISGAYRWTQRHTVT